MHTRFKTLLASTALLLAAPMVQAETFAFNGLIDSGLLNEQTFSGSFAYASGLANGEVALTAFSMELAGHSYTLAGADAAATALFVQGSFVGLQYADGDAVLPDRPQIAFVAGFENFAQAYLAYEVNGQGGFGSYTLSPVPEPSTWGLMLGGLGLTAAALRRRAPSA